MIAKSSKSILKTAMAPVILVAVLWVTMSSTTTYFVQWLEWSHQRFMAEHIVSMRAADSLLTQVWRLTAEFPEDTSLLPAYRRQWNDASATLVLEQKRLGQSAASSAEQQALANVEQALDAYREFLKSVVPTPLASAPHQEQNLTLLRRHAIELASQVAMATAELLKINQANADRDEAKLQRVSRNVLIFRLSVLVFGPLLGVFLGWRLGIQLHRSITRISVTLHDAGSSEASDVGTVAIESSGDFQDVQQQAEQVAERMRQVSRDLQNARREVVQSERLAAVGELAAGVAHEIRNPLTSVKLLLQHAIRQTAGPHLSEDNLRLILEEIGRMESTIQGLLDFSRPPRLNRITHDFRQTLRRALNLIDARARQQGIQIIANVADVPLQVHGDTEKLHQVLVNLLINGIEAMPTGGQLTIRASLVSAPGTAIESDQASVRRHIRVEVCDTGEGIPPELLPRLFEPFATTKERGTGLGLAISRRIVEEHHAELHASNLPHRGAIFVLTMEEARSEPATPQPQDFAGPARS